MAAEIVPAAAEGYSGGRSGGGEAGGATSRPTNSLAISSLAALVRHRPRRTMGFVQSDWRSRLMTVSVGQYIKHFQYGCGVITVSGA